MPNAYIITGPNGAGKSTYYRRYFRRETGLDVFVNADAIASALSPGNPAKVAMEAGRIMHERLRALVAERVDFVFETTLAGRTYASFLTELRTAGYRIRLDFLWIRDLGIVNERVEQRARKGGHDIPADVQSRRFNLGISNLARLYRSLVDDLRLMDNSEGNHLHIVRESFGIMTIVDSDKLAEIEKVSNVVFMPDPSTPQAEESGLKHYDAETRGMIRAGRLAFADVIVENLTWGMPVIVGGKNGGTVALPSEQLVPLARRIYATDGELSQKEYDELRSLAVEGPAETREQVLGLAAFNDRSTPDILRLCSY